jgi:hypothetical protein
MTTTRSSSGVILSFGFALVVVAIVRLSPITWWFGGKTCICNALALNGVECQKLGVS